MFKREYSRIFEGDEHWKSMAAPTGPIYAWDPNSTYVKEPPYFEGFAPQPKVLTDIEDARVLAVLGDSVTTDHISPAGAIPVDSPAGRYLIEKGVDRFDFNSFGARRGNHEVMERGTFGNIRLRNALVEREGFVRAHQRLLAECGIRYLACEGGQTVLSELHGAGLLDEVFLTVTDVVIDEGAHDGVLRSFDFQAEGAELLAEGKISRDSGYTFQRWRFQEARR